MTASHGEATGSLPVLTATYAAGDQDGLPSARATARLFPLNDRGERILLAVAESVGDPSSAEAQAAESLARIEATVARAPQEAGVESILDAGYGAARDALRRLMSLPGSEPRAGVALVAAIVEDGAITAANVGRGAAFLRRSGRIVRLTADQRPELGHYPPLLPGEGEAAQPLLSPAHPLQAGDTVLLCSEAIARGLGQEVIEAVVEDYGVDGAADELCDLAASLPEGAGAAAALLHLPGPAAAPVVTPPAMPVRVATAGGSRPTGLRVPLIVGAVIVAALVAAAAIVYSATRPGNSGDAVTRQAPSSPTVQAAAVPVTPFAAAGSLTPAASESPTPSTSSTPSGSATPGAFVTPGATGTPGSLANAPVCASINTKPCRFTAQPGDNLSAIGDRFDITRACFEAANINHDPLPPRAPDYRIGAGETYAIPDAAGCAALPPVPAPPPAPVVTARATATATARVTASAAGTPSRAATPTTRAGTAAPAASASAAPATTAPAPGGAATARPVCTPTGGETFPRASC